MHIFTVQTAMYMYCRKCDNGGTKKVHNFFCYNDMHVYMFVLFNRSIGTVWNNTQSHIVGLNQDVTVSMWLTCLDNSTTLMELRKLQETGQH